MLPEEQIEKALEVLRNDGIILYPTDTVWGLGGRFDSEIAYQRLQKIKRRDANQPFILLVSCIDQLKEYVTYVHPRIETLLYYHERPLTLVYYEHRNIPSHCISQNGSVAIRIAKDKFCQKLTRELGMPITSTSANSKGQETPKHFGEIKSDILSKADFVFDYRRSKNFSGVPSVIAEFNKKGDLVFHRQ